MKARLSKLENRVKQIEETHAAQQGQQSLQRVPPEVLIENADLQRLTSLFLDRVLADNTVMLDDIIEAEWGMTSAEFSAQVNQRMQAAADVYYQFRSSPYDYYTLDDAQRAAVEAANRPIAPDRDRCL